MVSWTAPHDVERNQAEVRQCLARGFVRNLEIDYVTPTGQINPVEINATVLAASPGNCWPSPVGKRSAPGSSI
jgi:hypothetical protein